MKLTAVRFGKLKLSVREQILLMILGVLFYILGGYYLLLKPTQASIAEKRATLEDLTAQVSEIEPWITITDRLPDIILGEDNKLISLKQEIPTSVEMESILNLLNGTPDGSIPGIVQKTGVILNAIKPDQDVKDNTIAVNIQLSGTMEQLQGFLAELKSAKRFNTVKVINHKGSGVANQYSSEMVVNFYKK